MIIKPVCVLALIFSCCFVLAATPQEKAKVGLVNKIYKEMRFLPYAEPALVQLVRRGEQAAVKIDDDLGCEMGEHGYLGMANGDSETPYVQQLTIKVAKNGWVNTQYMADGKSKQKVDFLLSCTGNVCQVRDVVLAGKSSYKKDYEYIIKHNTCPSGTTY